MGIASLPVGRAAAAPAGRSSTQALDRVADVPADELDDRIDVDAVRHVVDEVDQRRHAHEREQDADGEREVRRERALFRVRTLRSTISAYENVPRKAPRLSWTPRSRVKLRSRRGPIWPAASESAAIVIENTVPATPMVEAATAPRSVRAPVPPPL